MLEYLDFSFGEMPLVTRIIMIPNITSFVLKLFGFNVNIFYFHKYLVIYNYQIWRLITPFFVCYRKDLYELFELYFLTQDLRTLEVKKFKRNTAALLFYFICCVMPLITAQGFFFNIYYALNFRAALRFAILFTNSRYEPERIVNFMLRVKIKQKYILICFILLHKVMYGDEALNVILAGSFAGYVYSCLEHGDFGLITDILKHRQYRSDTSFVEPPRFFTATINALTSFFKKIQRVEKVTPKRSSKEQSSGSTSSSFSRFSGSNESTKFQGKGRTLG